LVHPNESRLKKLQKQWDKDLEKAKAEGDDSILIASITSTDKSPFNLSSIVCLVEFNEKRMLLTGDGRCDDIYAGLKKNKLLDSKGKLHVDILKIPHHGSNANIKADFLQKITADHYVISADGKHNNPDKETLDMIAENIKKGTLYLTNHDGELGLKTKLDKFLKHLNDSNSKLNVHFRESEKASLIINLLDEIGY
jgi:beta-lactamase superfamily II metal-dependent hydrolase